MKLRTFFLPCLAHASYLVADERTKLAAVIDPQRDVEFYLQTAAELGVTIRYVLLTHFHADFVAGHLELRRQTGAGVYLGAGAAAEYSFTPLRDGDVLEFGDVRLRVLETPGHAPESISIELYDLRASDRAPHAVFTGDTLLVGDVGRPDLSSGLGARELAALLHESLHRKLLRLPDATLVLPAHGAGSLCGHSSSESRVSTIGEQRHYNHALQPMTRDEFVALVTDELGDTPPNFERTSALNRRERATLDETLEQALKPLSPEAVTLLIDAGAQVLDSRPARDFAATHFAGSINVPLDGPFAFACGAVLDPQRIVVVVADPGRERETATRLGRVGFDHIAGVLSGGVASLAGRPKLTSTLDHVTARALHERMSKGNAGIVIDVRTSTEFRQAHIAGAIHAPLREVVERCQGLNRDRELAVVCKTSYRSSVAASLLRAAGFIHPMVVTGGIDAWRALGLALTEQRS